ncbi:MAG: DUF309 domain-containing protein [Cyanobacteria bacterium J06598_1]
MPISSEKNQPLDNSSALDNSSDSCSDHSQAFQRGIDEFNSGQFYACHDTLEAIWMAVDHAEKPFYQGILQIAVAFYHLGNLNWRGGAILLGEGLSRLGRFEPNYQGVNVETLVDQSVEWLEWVQVAGEEGLAALMADKKRSCPQIQKI